MTDSFWRDPPRRGGKAGYRMGLRPIEPNAWLPDRIGQEEVARKRRLLSDAANGVFAELAESRAGQQKILDAVNVALANTHIASSHVAPIVVASLQVPDDLCLMQRFNDVLSADRGLRLLAVVLAPRRKDRPHARRYSRSGADAQRQALSEDGAVLHAITRGGDLRASQLADAHQPGAVSTRIRGLGRSDIRQRSTTGSAFRATDLAPPRFRFGDVHDTRDLPSPRRNSELPRSRARPVGGDRQPGCRERAAKGHRYFAPAVSNYLRSVI